MSHSLVFLSRWTGGQLVVDVMSHRQISVSLTLSHGGLEDKETSSWM